MKSPPPAEWTRLAHLYDEINRAFIDYGEQTAFLLQCRDRFAPAAATALDLGCATGLHVKALAAEGLGVVGVDISERLIGEGLRGSAAPRLICGDMRALPLHGPLDLVYCLNFVFSFLHTDDAIRAALAEVRRVLSPGGVFVLDYHHYTVRGEANPLTSAWKERCRVGGRRLVMTHRPTVDAATGLATDRITYQFMEGREVVREVETAEVRRIMPPGELIAAIQAAGLSVEHHCARFDLDAAPGDTGVLAVRRA